MIVPKIIFVFAIIISARARVLLPIDTRIKAFIILFILLSLMTLYIIYSYFEFKFLHEKQGAKLEKSKQKLNTVGE